MPCFRAVFEMRVSAGGLVGMIQTTRLAYLRSSQAQFIERSSLRAVAMRVHQSLKCSR